MKTIIEDYLEQLADLNDQIKKEHDHALKEILKNIYEQKLKELKSIIDTQIDTAPHGQ